MQIRLFVFNWFLVFDFWNLSFGIFKIYPY
jgi:hypothetical protein